MDLPTIMNGFSNLVAALSGALLVYGGWLSLGHAAEIARNARPVQPAGLSPQPEAALLPRPSGP